MHNSITVIAGITITGSFVSLIKWIFSTTAVTFYKVQQLLHSCKRPLCYKDRFKHSQKSKMVYQRRSLKTSGLQWDSNPVEALIFVRLLLSNCLKLEDLLLWSFFTFSNVKVSKYLCNIYKKIFVKGILFPYLSVCRDI